eukprot:scaffold4242_cov20-Tisochrysis_lutea.AAC.5
MKTFVSDGNVLFGAHAANRKRGAANSVVGIASPSFLPAWRTLPRAHLCSPMKAVARHIQQLINRPYKFGFKTLIESETFPKGLDEDVVSIMLQDGVTASVQGQSRLQGEGWSMRNAQVFLVTLKLVQPFENCGISSPFQAGSRPLPDCAHSSHGFAFSCVVHHVQKQVLLHMHIQPHDTLTHSQAHTHLHTHTCTHSLVARAHTRTHTHTHTQVRAISAKKNEPDWMLEFRLKAFRKWLTMEEPRWSDNSYPTFDYQGISYYSEPKIKEKKKSLDEVGG